MAKPSQLEQLIDWIKKVGAEEAAQKSGVASRTIYYIQAGRTRPSYRTLQKLVGAAGLK
jgi:transcriptional regulator with XRE-family HTH domain